jgi:hypothetical protein
MPIADWVHPVFEAGLGEAGVGRGNEGAFVQFGTEVGCVSLVAVKHEPVSRCLVP